MKVHHAIGLVLVTMVLVGSGCAGVGYNEQFRITRTQPPEPQRVYAKRRAKAAIDVAAAPRRGDAGEITHFECAYIEPEADADRSEPDGKKGEKEKRKKKEETKWMKQPGCVYLPQYTLRNRYDKLAQEYTESDGKPIRAGDPVNVIINRVWIGDNHEAKALRGRAEIGVVVSAYDASEKDGKDVLVSYEKGIDDDILLPIADLLAYSTTDYQNEALRITLTVFEFDQQENEMLSEILGMAATAGAAAQPAAAPAIGLASEIGKFLIKSKQDDVIAKMTFQLYPWHDGEAAEHHQDFGVPYIATGSYLIVNAKGEDEIALFQKHQSERTIYLDADLEPVIVKRSNGVAKSKKAPNYEWAETEPLGLTHVVISVASSPVFEGERILARIDEVTREAAGLQPGVALDAGRTESLMTQVRAVQSSLELARLQAQQRRAKKDPSSLLALWDPSAVVTSANDRDELAVLLLERLPSDLAWSEPCRSEPLGAECKKAFSEKARKGLAYDEESDRYVPIPD